MKLQMKFGSAWPWLVLVECLHITAGMAGMGTSRALTPGPYTQGALTLALKLQHRTLQIFPLFSLKEQKSNR